MLDHAVLYHRNNFVLIRHLTEENKYSLGTAQTYEGYKKNTDSFPVDESFISAEEMIERMKSWQKIDEKHNDVNNTFAAEQEIIEVLERELVKQSDIVIDFKDIISELSRKNVRLCTINSELHNWGLCIEDNEKNLYQMECYFSHSYLKYLIKTGAVVKFERVWPSLSKSVGEWERKILTISDLKLLLQRHGLELNPSLADKIQSAESRVSTPGKVKEKNNTYER